MKGKIFATLFALPFFGVGVWMAWSVASTIYDASRMQQWAQELLDGCAAIAALIDGDQGNDDHAYALDCQQKKLDDPQCTPSARILAQMRDQGIPFFRFAMNASLAHAGYYANHPLRDKRLAEFVALAEKSIEEQAAMEAAETEPFEAFLEHYLALP